ncbi:MAG: hypothetical protein WBD83_17340, partial [Xanthobacteraceae bacterium]
HTVQTLPGRSGIQNELSAISATRYFSRYSTFSNCSTICSAAQRSATSPPAAASFSWASTRLPR